MKHQKEWAESTRKAMGNFLRADPILVSGQSLLEDIIAHVQLEAIVFAKNNPDKVDAEIEKRTIKVVGD